MTEHLLFVTGKLAEASLRRVLEDMKPTEFSHEIRQLGVSVAALITADMIRRRLKDIGNSTAIVLPGRCRGDLKALSEHFRIPVERGPDELKDLPSYFGRAAKQPDLSRYDVKIFAEIVDAPHMSVDAIVQRAKTYVEDGANVIDLGCLPDTPFPQLEDAVAALKTEGLTVSIDSLQPNDLITGGRTGADYLLSLKEDTLWVAQEVEAIPVLIPSTPRDMASLNRAIDMLQLAGRHFIADPILEPIHFGFADSLVRYHQLRQKHPGIEIMMGVGNLTELTDADTPGVNALLMGILSELHITNLLTTQVSSHCRTVVRELDLARRIMYAARADHSLPQKLHDGLLALRDKKPFPYSSAEIEETARHIRDPSFRIQVSDEGISLYNRNGLCKAIDPYDFFSNLGVEEDGAHAFYLGVELARAQIAWQLGKRYVQDEELAWGCAVDAPSQGLDRYKPAGATLEHRRKKQ